MLHPTIDELTQGKFNRYELALATARCARLITDEYVRQHDVAERSQTGNKETDRPINTMIDRELRGVADLQKGAYGKEGLTDVKQQDGKISDRLLGQQLRLDEQIARHRHRDEDEHAESRCEKLHTVRPVPRDSPPTRLYFTPRRRATLCVREKNFA